METGCGEFSIRFNNKDSLCFYRAYGRYFKDVFKNNTLMTKNSIEISKDEYLRKLNNFIKILENED